MVRSMVISTVDANRYKLESLLFDEVSYSKHKRFCTAMCTVLKVIATGEIEKYKGITKTRHLGMGCTYYYNDFNFCSVDMLTPDEEDYSVVMLGSCRVVLFNDYKDLISVDNDYKEIIIPSTSNLLIPTEEQYFQNSLLYDRAYHLCKFLLYGSILQLNLQYCSIDFRYNQVFELEELILKGDYSEQYQ